MYSTYKENPGNFPELEPYVILDKEELAECIIKADRCYFYDACSLRNHMSAEKPELIFEYIRRTCGVVVLTRCIIMELCSDDGCLWIEHIEYIKRMQQYGIKVIVMYEEDVFCVLRTYCSDTARINEMLSFAVKCVKSKAGIIESVLGSSPKLKRELLGTCTNKNSMLAEQLFKEIRKNKQAKDSLGEELLAVCVHWLANMRDINEYKYIILTDDRKVVPVISKAMKNSEEHNGKRAISVLTTTRLCSLLVKEGIIAARSQIISILSGTDSRIRLFCSEKFELGPTDKSMSVSEFADKVIKREITVYF